MGSRHISRKSLSIETLPSFEKNQLLAIVYAAFPFLIIGLLHNWQLQGPLVLFKNFVSDGNVVGNFALAMQILILTTALPQAVEAASLPILSRAAERGERKDVLFLSVVVRIAFFVGCAAGLLGDVIGPGLIPMIFGPGFELAGTYLGIIFWFMTPLFIVFLLSTTLLVREKYLGVFVANAIGAIALSASFVPLSNNMGMEGGVYAVGIGVTTTAALLCTTAAKSGLLSAREVLLPSAIAVLFAYLAQTASSSLGQIPSAVIGFGVLLIMVSTAGVVKKHESDAVIGLVKAGKTNSD